MFKPVKMMRVILQVLHTDVAKVTHVIAKQGLMHLLNSEKFAKQIGKASRVSIEQFQDTLNRYNLLDQELNNMFANLSIKRKISKDLEVDPPKDIEAIENAIKGIQQKLKASSDRLKRIEDQRQEKDQKLELLRSIAAAGSDLETVRQFTYFYKTVGFIITKDIPRLEASLASIRYILVPLLNVERRSLIIVLCSQNDKQVLERALTSAYFERIDLPDFSQGHIEDIINNLADEITRLAEERIQLSEELHRTQNDVVEELQVLKEKVALALVILKAEQFYGKTARSYTIVGWIPKDQVEPFQQEIVRVTEGRARFEFLEPELVDEVQQGVIKIPILFKNPYLIKPFETIVFNYGTQDYREVDPTPVVALSFLLMFGMMFGDIGHGLVLFLIGYGLFRKFYQFMDYAIIMMECGVSSAIFGVLYGSIFGVEHWIPALWLHPAENINSFMKFAIGLGVVMVTSGIILNIINAYQRKDYEDVFLGHYGVIGGLFYWIAVGLGLKYAIYGNLGLSTEALILLFAVPLGGIFFREPLAHLLFHHEKGEKIFPSGVGMFIMEAVIDVMDVVIRYLGNTVSFIRTAAFALAHGGLFIAVFSLAEIMGELKGGGLWYWVVIFLGNVLIIALEGLVVSIQTIRLEYYEFFSKFFRGGGEKFQPLTIE